MPDFFDYSGAIDDLEAMFRRARHEVVRQIGTDEVWDFYDFARELANTIADFTEANDAITHAN